MYNKFTEMGITLNGSLEGKIEQIFKEWLWEYEVLGIKLGEGKIDLTVVEW